MSTTTPEQGTLINSLTTTFTPPPGCVATFKQLCSTCSYAFRGQECNGDAFQDGVTCWPPSAPTISTQAPLNGWGYYSPGLVCPSGHTSACTNIAPLPSGATASPLSLLSPFAFQFALRAGETAVGCCPNGYTCAVRQGFGGGQTCQSVASATTISASVCVSGSTTPTTIALPIITPFSDSSTTITVLTFAAPLIQINWQSSDRPSSSSSSTSQAPSTITTPTTLIAPNSTISPSAQSHPGLSTGAKVGIGIGVPVFVLFLLCAAAMVWRRMRQRKLPSELLSAEAAADEKMVLEPQELPVLAENGGGIKELPTGNDRAEMPVDEVIHEIGPGEPGNREVD